ncbi:flavodoxin family protein [Mobilitalea sibirica]|uniref:Flavodoxin family protein n=1 Tax=Mobilitalea sibirica TaxID=1462919 RepID=A0A8J7HEA5_9FIRM|nr:flavodoxin family protein [Mobilitalea sibirica]MBH1941809.1 flavodoxin family protein [Mobilitalea sibirica]
MSKNILVLTGSPRRGGNSDKLADAFIAGACLSGHKTIKYSTAEKNIKGCIDCKTCFSKGVACSVPDDFNELAPLLEQSDMLVLATPLYWYSFPVQLKAAIDKLYSFIIGNRALKIKECVLLVCGGDKDEVQYEGIVKSYKLIADFLKWKDKGIIIAPEVYDKDDILKTDALMKAELLGKSIL